MNNLQTKALNEISEAFGLEPVFRSEESHDCNEPRNCTFCWELKNK